MAQIEVTRDVLVEDAVFILQCLRQNQRGGRSNGLADVRQTLANSVTLDLSDYVAFLRRFGYVDVDRRAVALQLTAEGDRAAVGETGDRVAEHVGEHFAPLLAQGSVEVDDVEGGSALEALLASAGLAPAPQPETKALPATTSQSEAKAQPEQPALPGLFAEITLPHAPTPETLSQLAAAAEAARAARGPLVVRTARLELAEGEIGQGALGRVRAARFGELGRTVAVKQIKPLHEYLPWLTRPELCRRALLEARAQAQLAHPCVLPVFDVQVSEAGEPLIVQQLAVGGSLRQKLAQKLPLVQILRLSAQVASVLAQAHAAGLTHTALKPENVLFDGRGNALVADFGMRRLVAVPAAAERAPRVSIDLHDGAYRAPEVTAFAPIEPAADAYAFGVILYELLTGQLPGRRSPAPSVIRPEVGRELDELCDGLLEDDPSRRPSLQAAAARLALAMGPQALYLL